MGGGVGFSDVAVGDVTVGDVAFGDVPVGGVSDGWGAGRFDDVLFSKNYLKRADARV